MFPEGQLLPADGFVVTCSGIAIICCFGTAEAGKPVLMTRGWLSGTCWAAPPLLVGLTGTPLAATDETAAAPITPTGRWLRGAAGLLEDEEDVEEGSAGLGRILRGGVGVLSLPLLSLRPLGPKTAGLAAEMMVTSSSGDWSVDLRGFT